jgi:POT family proton-dependent oligopeptide transporter
MKSTVQAIALFTSAVSSALGQALVGLSEDPLLEWNYGSVAVVAILGAVGFWLTFRKADKEEDALNALQTSKYMGRKEGDVEVVAESPVSVRDEKNEKTAFN